MSGRLLIFLNTFVERFQCCYRDGLDGTVDMRSFSGIYFLLKIIIYSAEILSRITLNLDQHFAREFVFIIAALLITLSRPYKKTYMNVMDTILLSHMATFCYIIASTSNLNHRPSIFLLLMHVMIAVPFIIVFLFTAYRMTHGIFKKHFKWISVQCSEHLKTTRERVYSCFTSQNLNLTFPEIIYYGTIN